MRSPDERREIRGRAWGSARLSLPLNPGQSRLWIGLPGGGTARWFRIG